MDTTEELLQRFQNGCNSVRKISGILHRIRQSTHRRIGVCVAVRGQHSVHLL
jgi:hypothetical protein